MSNSPESSPTLSNNLRCFRFQKKPSLAFNGDGGTLDTTTEDSPVKSQPVRRRIKPIQDSDSEGDVIQAAEDATRPEDTSENSNSSVGDALSAKLKELVRAFPNHDVMVLQDTLLRNSWDTQAAMNEILESNSSKKRSRPNGAIKKKVKRRRNELEDTDDSDFDGNPYSDNRVFDSDEDSDIEISNDLSGERKKVYDFLQTATANELRLMSSCSQKKVDAILQLRPFDGWVDLIDKFQKNKFLSLDLLNAAQQVLATRSSIQQLMTKCTNLAQQMERAVSGGAGVKAQPKVLNPR